MAKNSFVAEVTFNNLIDISSYFCALLILKECIILRISRYLNEIDDKLTLVARGCCYCCYKQ